MRLCITGGGTGGHLMIAQSLVEVATLKGHKVIFIGSTNGQDRKYFEDDKSFESVYFLDTTGVVNQKGFKKLKALFKIFKAFLNSRKILKDEKIDATYSVGGFSAAPASFATLSLFIPLFMHEQNAVMGRLNSLLRPYAKRFISAYEEDSPIKGYPVKESFVNSARVRTKLNTIIFLGGSHGATYINDLAISVSYELKKRDIRIIHQAGEKDYDRVKKEYEKLGVDVELLGFSKELPSLIEQADLAVSRAGASTLWELTANGCPAFYIPYPHAAGDHQYYNAKFIVEHKLGWCERQGDDLKDKLLKVIEEDLEAKSKALLKYTSSNVASKMIDDVAGSIN